MTPIQIDIHIGRRVQERRREKDLLQKTVAAQLGITAQQLSKFEVGANRMSCRQLYGVAIALSVEPGWFFEGLPGVRSER
jgi:transcriptional regulator with XRE-family HTH domain